MKAKGWIILILVIIAVVGVAFLYFYSPLASKNETKPQTPSIPSYQPFQTNQTPQPYHQVYNGVLNGTLSGYMFDGIVSNQYIGLFNGTYNGYGWINNKPVYLSTSISNGRMTGVISGQHRGNEFQGNILANVENAQMNGTVTYIPVEVKEPITFWSLFKKIWWIFLLVIVFVVIIWLVIRLSGVEEIEKHTITEIDISIRPILEGEPYDREIKRFIRSKAIPNSIKPKYHQILYLCNFPNGEYILVDAKFDRVLKVHTDISAPDIKKHLDEISVTMGGEGGPFPYGGGGYGGYRPSYRRPYAGYGRHKSRRPPPEGGEYSEGEEGLT